MFKQFHLIKALLLAVAITVLTMAPALAAHGSANKAQEAFQTGIIALEQGNYQTAVEEFTEAIEYNPHGAFSNRCLAYLLLNEYPQALADCTQAVNLNSTNSEPYLNRGLVHYRLGNYQAAIADYTQLLQLQPDFRAYYNRGLAQFALNNYDAAIADYGQSLNNSPKDLQTAQIYGDRGMAYLMQGKPQQAIADFTQAIALNPQDPRAWFNRASAYYQHKDYGTTLQDLDRVLTLSPDNAQAYLNRGIVRHQLSNLPGAIADLQTAARYFYYQGAAVSYKHTLNLLEYIHPTHWAIG